MMQRVRILMSALIWAWCRARRAAPKTISNRYDARGTWIPTFPRSLRSAVKPGRRLRRDDGAKAVPVHRGSAVGNGRNRHGGVDRVVCLFRVVCCGVLWHCILARLHSFSNSRYPTIC